MIDYPVSKKLRVRSEALCWWWIYSTVTAGYILARSEQSYLNLKRCSDIKKSKGACFLYQNAMWLGMYFGKTPVYKAKTKINYVRIKKVFLLIATPKKEMQVKMFVMQLQRYFSFTE